MFNWLQKMWRKRKANRFLDDLCEKIIFSTCEEELHDRVVFLWPFYYGRKGIKMSDRSIAKIINQIKAEREKMTKKEIDDIAAEVALEQLIQIGRWF